MMDDKLLSNARKIITDAIKTYVAKHGAVKRDDLFLTATQALKLTKEQIANKQSNSLYNNCRSLIGSIINELINAGFVKIADTSTGNQKLGKNNSAEAMVAERKKIILEYLTDKYITEVEGKVAIVNILKSIINDKTVKNELEKSHEHALAYVEKKFVKAARITNDNSISFPDTPVGIVLRNQHKEYNQFLQKKLSNENYIQTLDDAIIDVIKKNGGPFFEKVSLDLIKMIYGEKHYVVDSDKITGGSNDHGIDSELTIIDDLGFEEKLVIQSKLGGKGESGEKAIREFMGSMDFAGAQKGVFISASPISTVAKIFAKSTKRTARRLLIIDEHILLEKMKEYGLGVKKDKAGNFIIDADYFVVKLS